MYRKNNNLKINTAKVREIMALKCWTVDDLAKAAGVAYNTASNFVNNNGFPYPSTLKKFCNALECTTLDIVEQKEG